VTIPEPVKGPAWVVGLPRPAHIALAGLDLQEGQWGHEDTTGRRDVGRPALLTTAPSLDHLRAWHLSVEGTEAKRATVACDGTQVASSVQSSVDMAPVPRQPWDDL